MEYVQFEAEGDWGTTMKAFSAPSPERTIQGLDFVSLVRGWKALAFPGDAWLGPIFKVGMLFFFFQQEGQ
jgi:hypothetical protein